MTQKYEWRKKEKQMYLPGEIPEVIRVPSFQFLTIEGAGNPNSAAFSEYIGVLYSLSYAIKMNLKQRRNIENYNDYTVYPLEGVWDISEEAKKTFTGTVNKDDLVFKLMIRQPDFVSEEFYKEMLALVKKEKPHSLLNEVAFESIEEGECIQMLHVGSYDDEEKSFQLMEAHAQQMGLNRINKKHREIYLSDFRKVASENLKTVLRFKVEENVTKKKEHMTFRSLLFLSAF